MRAFLAISLPKEVQAACRKLAAGLRPDAPKVRWVKPENIHLTLRFFGDIDEGVGERIVQALKDTAAVTAPFEARAGGLGVFPNARKASVVWVAIQPEGEGLARLQAAAEKAAQEAGLPAEKRRYTPHLTLGRIRQPGPAIDWPALISRHADFEAGAWTVRDVALFSSELHPAGARYSRLAAVPLGTPPLGTPG